MTWGRADLQGRTPHWLLDLTVEGRVYRVADEDLTVTDAGGLEYVYQEGLGDLEMKRGELAQPDAAIPVTIEIGESWGDLVARGVSLNHARVQLRRWFEGMVLDQAQTYLEGLAADPVYDTEWDALDLVLVRRVRGRAFAVLDDDAVVDATTWPDSGVAYVRDEKVEGQYYPKPFGFPGRTYSGGNVKPAVPALLVKVSTNVGETADRMLIGDSVLACADVSSGVRIWRTDTRPATSELFNTVSGTDSIGRPVTLVDVGTPASLVVEEGGEYWAGFRAAAGGGTIDPATGAAVHGCGSLILYLLRTYSSERVDVGRMTATAERLDQILIDAVINAGDVDPHQWIASNLATILPIERVDGPDGCWYRLWQWDATEADAIAWLDADEDGNCEQVGRPEDAGIDIYNHFVLAYQQDRISNRYRARTVLQAESDSNDSRKLEALICTRSQAEYGRIRAPRLQSPVLWNPPSAVACNALRAAQHAWPKRGITVRLDTDWEYLEEGDVVVYTHTDSGISSQVALVSSIAVGSPTAMAVGLILLDHPVHMLHTP